MIYLVQPPLVQLNAPYPSIYYLRSFLEKQGLTVRTADHSIGLFEKVFCRDGLRLVFSEAASVYKNRGNNQAGPPVFEENQVIYYIEGFLSEEEKWIRSINRLISFLRGEDREFGHLLGLANGILPGSPRLDAYLDSVEGQPPPDAAGLMAGKLLADLAEFIRLTLDPSFALIRYEQSSGKSIRDFSAVLENLSGFILDTFYGPYLKREWETMDIPPGEPLILGCSIPFPGCLTGALYCAESARKYFGNRVTTIAGGGYVNTELRSLGDDRFFDFFDYLSFDRGYGSLAAILKDAGSRTPRGGQPLYKTMYRLDETGQIIKPGDDDKIFSEIDGESPVSVFPDYSSVDFSRYIYPVDDTNPMHRLWSDGHWLKVYLAHGCYWHNCAFCDVSLDYIKGFRKVDPDALFGHLLDQVEKTGIRGIHLVDEAAPVSSLLRLAELNRQKGLPFFFWGNIRFEKSFTPDTAALLAAGGLVGVSAGIEVASGKGFQRIGKGIGFDDVVSACAAFKESGILTHAYLIYGYWDEDDAEIIDSAEVMRQFFETGLLDSTFWHKFVLTRHSKIYTEKLQGNHESLIIKDPLKINPRMKVFADNDLGFEGENRFDKFTVPLDSLAAAWMAGDTSLPVGKAFPFKVPKPSVPEDFISFHISEYARRRDKCFSDYEHRRHVFLGSKPMVIPGKTETLLRWRWKISDYEYGFAAGEDQVRALADILIQASPGSGMDHTFDALASILGKEKTIKFWKVLREGGLTACQEKTL